jgi:hypothetical protein
MPQILLQGCPDGATRIGSTLSVLRKEGRVAYFVGPYNFYSHSDSDLCGQCFAIATLIANGHVRPSEVKRSALGIAHQAFVTSRVDGPRVFHTDIIMTPSHPKAL